MFEIGPFRSFNGRRARPKKLLKSSTAGVGWLPSDLRPAAPTPAKPCEERSRDRIASCYCQDPPMPPPAVVPVKKQKARKELRL